MPETSHRNFRLSDVTLKQIEDLSTELGLNGTQVVILAVAKLWRLEIMGIGKPMKKSQKTP